MVRKYTLVIWQMLLIKFSDIYKKEEEVIKRKPDKRTAFLDKLRAAIIEKCKEEGYFP